MTRYSRNEALFGSEGQKRLRDTRPVIVGVGGLGTHIVQQVSLLGVGAIALVDHETVDVSNLNRYVGTTPDSVGRPKVEIGAALARSIDPTLAVDFVHDTVWSADASRLISQATHIFGCLDSDGARYVLNEIASAFSIPYVDCATDVDATHGAIAYGGRVFVNWDGQSCLACMSLLDPIAATRELEGKNARIDRGHLYGVPTAALAEFGPSVVSLNGVLASLATTEFMAGVTGLRRPARLLQYYGNLSRMTVNNDPPENDCYYCVGVRGSRRVTSIARLSSALSS